MGLDQNPNIPNPDKSQSVQFKTQTVQNTGSLKSTISTNIILLLICYLSLFKNLIY